MRIRFSIELRIEHPHEPQPERFEHRDNDGTLSENIGHPRYVGFIREDEKSNDA